MQVKKGVSLQGLHPVMRKVLKKAESLWKESGQPEGITVTATMDGVHSAGSWHYCGCAVDLRTRYWSKETRKEVYNKLKAKLPEYDVVYHSTHIHVEPSDSLAKQWRLML